MGGTPFDEGERNYANGMLVQGGLMVVLGATVLILGAVNVLPELSKLNDLASVWSAAGGTLDSIAITFLTLGTAAGGLVMAFGLVGVLSFFRKSRLLASVSLAFVMGGSILEIVGGALYLGVVSRSYASVVVLGDDLSAPIEERVFLDAAIATFNRCCHDRYGSSTDPLLVNAQPGNKDLTADFQQEILECGVTPLPLGTAASTLGDGFKNLLQVCYLPESYTPADKYIFDFALCEGSFSEIIVSVDDEIVIPTTSIKLKTFLVTQGILEEKDGLSDLVLVGLPAFFVPEGTQGSGCGLMHAKGVAWAQHLYIAQVGEAASYVMIGAASLQILSIAFIIALWVLASDETQEEWMDYDRKVGAAVGQEDKVDF